MRNLAPQLAPAVQTHPTQFWLILDIFIKLVKDKMYVPTSDLFKCGQTTTLI